MGAGVVTTCAHEGVSATDTMAVGVGALWRDCRLARASAEKSSGSSVGAGSDMCIPPSEAAMLMSQSLRRSACSSDASE